jgi:hypothetical protein
MGALTFGIGLTYVLATGRAPTIAHRAAFGVALATAFLLIWVNLAVGIIGEPGNNANLMYLGVLAVGTVGTVLARFRAHGMVRAVRDGVRSSVGRGDRAGPPVGFKGLAGRLGNLGPERILHRAVRCLGAVVPLCRAGAHSC